jgi:uncharacterized protein (TIGR02453 family)
MTRFIGFGPELFAFLAGLKANNHKAWFDAHRGDYESAVKAPLGDLIDVLAAAFAKAKLNLTGDRKASMFRMNKDIRFSKDKTPYKTNVGAVLTPGGTKKEPGVYYIHFEPGASFLAAGFYMPEPPTLLALRTAMIDDTKTFRKVLAGLAKAELSLDRDDALSRPPKGFADVTDAELIEHLKLKHVITSRPLADDEVLSADLVARCVSFAKQTKPLLDFGYSAITAAK